MQKKPHILWTLYRVWRVWRKYPMLRLGQLLVLATDSFPRGPDVFYLRDEDLVAKLDAFVRETR